MNTQEFKFNWDINNIIDKTKFSKEEKKPIVLSNDNKTCKRVERLQGDDYPPVRILANQYVSLDGDNVIKQWSIHIDQTRGFTEIGIIDPVSNQVYFIKGFKNEAQSEQGHEVLSTVEFGETYTTGDTIKLNLSIDKSNKSLSLSCFKNDRLLGSPFKEIKLTENNKYYPFVGLNDDGDQITIV